MKKFLYLAGVLALLATASCKDDEGNTPAAGAVTFDGKSYAIKKGMVTDYGSWGTHYNYDFLLFNTTPTVAQLDMDEWPATFAVYAELFSPGTESFKTGTFTYNELPEADDYFFEYAQVIVDSNKDGKLSELDVMYSAESGTVTVSGTANNYTLTFNLTLEGGKKLTGVYTGSFEYIDETGGERAPDGGLRQSGKTKMFLK